MPAYLPKPPVCELRRDHPLAQGLVLAMPFDEGGGKRVRDLSGYGNHGTAQAYNKWVGGAHGWCMEFDGSSDYVGIPYADYQDLLPSSQFTISARVVTASALSTSGVDQRMIITRRGASGSAEANTGWGLFAIYYDSPPNYTGHMVEFAFWVGREANCTYELQPQTTVHVCVTNASATDVQIYVDGVALATQYFNSGGTLPPNTVTPRIGNWEYTTGDAWDGTIDDVRIYNRALSAAEIAEIYHDPFAIYRPPRVQWLVSAYVTAAAYRMLRRRAR